MTVSTLSLFFGAPGLLLWRGLAPRALPRSPPGASRIPPTTGKSSRASRTTAHRVPLPLTRGFPRARRLARLCPQVLMSTCKIQRKLLGTCLMPMAARFLCVSHLNTDTPEHRHAHASNTRESSEATTESTAAHQNKTQNAKQNAKQTVVFVYDAT